VDCCQLSDGCQLGLTILIPSGPGATFLTGGTGAGGSLQCLPTVDLDSGLAAPGYPRLFNRRFGIYCTVYTNVMVTSFPPERGMTSGLLNWRRGRR
jgi:hypothetical protein